MVLTTAAVNVGSGLSRTAARARAASAIMLRRCQQAPTRSSNTSRHISDLYMFEGSNIKVPSGFKTTSRTRCVPVGFTMNTSYLGENSKTNDNTTGRSTTDLFRQSRSCVSVCHPRHHRLYSSSSFLAQTQEVTITQTKTSPEQSNTCNDNDAAMDSQSQKTEERILEMQTHIRTHYRHAAYAEALETSRSLLDACQKLFGERHPSTASAYNNIGLMHKQLGDFDDARTNYQTSLQLYGDIVGKDHTSYAAALNNLGNLDRAQANMEEDLSPERRLELNESAVQYFDEALAVRTAELGEDHPQTVTSRSNLGGALAALVLQRHAAEAKAAAEKKKTPSDGDPQIDDAESKASSLKDNRGWEAAEEHLRSALNTATASPRGQKATIATHNKEVDARNKMRREEKKLSKRAFRKEKKKQQRQIMSRHIQETSIPAASEEDGGTGIQTLSAAAAAQNLAVFLKSRADVIGVAENSGMTMPPHLDRNDMYSESRRLYESALRVRNELRGEHHPDVVTTKFSLAELLATTGDEDGANKIRSEILEKFDITEKDEDDEDPESRKEA